MEAEVGIQAPPAVLEPAVKVITVETEILPHHSMIVVRVEAGVARLVKVAVQMLLATVVTVQHIQFQVHLSPMVAAVAARARDLGPLQVLAELEAAAIRM